MNIENESRPTIGEVRREFINSQINMKDEAIKRINKIVTDTRYDWLNLAEVINNYLDTLHPSEMNFNLLSLATKTDHQKRNEDILNSKVSKFIHEQGLYELRLN